MKASIKEWFQDGTKRDILFLILGVQRAVEEAGHFLPVEVIGRAENDVLDEPAHDVGGDDAHRGIRQIHFVQVLGVDKAAAPLIPPDQPHVDEDVHGVFDRQPAGVELFSQLIFTWQHIIGLIFMLLDQFQKVVLDLYIVKFVLLHTCRHPDFLKLFVL